MVFTLNRQYIKSKNPKFFYIEPPEIISRICKIELYLTTKIMNNRGTGYKPIVGDEDQPLRDELAMLRKKLNQNKNENR